MSWEQCTKKNKNRHLQGAEELEFSLGILIGFQYLWKKFLIPKNDTFHDGLW